MLRSSQQLCRQVDMGISQQVGMLSMTSARRADEIASRRLGLPQHCGDELWSDRHRARGSVPLQCAASWRVGVVGCGSSSTAGGFGKNVDPGAARARSTEACLVLREDVRITSRSLGTVVDTRSRSPHRRNVVLERCVAPGGGSGAPLASQRSRSPSLGQHSDGRPSQAIHCNRSTHPHGRGKRWSRTKALGHPSGQRLSRS